MILMVLHGNSIRFRLLSKGKPLPIALASTYQAMQQWEQARAIFEETFATTEGVLAAWLYIPSFGLTYL